MLRTTQWTVLFFIGLCFVCPGYGQIELPQNYNLPETLAAIGSIVSRSEENKNNNYDPDDSSPLKRHKESISDEAMDRFFEVLMSSSDEDRCFEDIRNVFNDTSAHDSLGLKMSDAFGKPNSAILEGNVKWLGSYHQCTNIKVPLENASEAVHFIPQYCVMDMTVEVFNQTLPITLGVCLPDTCGPVPAESFNAPELNSINVTRKVCQPTSRSLTSAAIAMIGVLSFVVLLSLVGSFVTVYEYMVERSRDTSVQYNEQINEGDTGIQIRDYATSDASSRNRRDNSGWRGTTKEFFNCFCIFTNGGKLLDITGTEGQLLCLHGIRFLSMSWVIVCHTYISVVPTVSNLLEAGTLVDTFLFQIIMNGYYSVDSFFLLSGFLVAYLYFREVAKTKREVPWLVFYVHRYIRLTPVYMMILGFYTALYYYVGSGPFWQITEMDPACQKYWWYNILYINNFAAQIDQCMGYTWYLANDMQFFVVCPIILITLWRWPPIGYTVLGLFMSATIASNIGITYYYNLLSGYGSGDGDIPLLNFNLLTFSEQQTQFYQTIYDKPYTRMSPYLIGILLAYILVRRKKSNAGKLNCVTLVFGWIFAAAISLACLFCLYHRQLSLVESALYNAFSHAAFSTGLSWVIFTCLNKQAGPVDSILSFKLFIPLSRLTYCAYLIHPMVVGAYFGSIKTAINVSHVTIVSLFFGLLALTYAISFMVSVLFESPIIRLEKFIRKKLS